MKSVEILLVEDDPGDVRLTAEALKECGFPFHLVVAKDGDEALNCLYKVGKFADYPTPELVLLDLNLPTINGQEVLKIIKHDRILSQIPIVILTTSKDEADVSMSYNLQANSFITKPDDIERFIEVIKATENYWVNVARLPQKAEEEKPAETPAKPKKPAKISAGSDKLN
jgi:two-component system, chemotaxis family, response regulator Rcp1